MTGFGTMLLCVSNMDSVFSWARNKAAGLVRAAPRAACPARGPPRAGHSQLAPLASQHEAARIRDVAKARIGQDN